MNVYCKSLLTDETLRKVYNILFLFIYLFNHLADAFMQSYLQMRTL